MTAEAPHPRIGVAGAGYWGRNLVRNFSDLGALRVICDTDSVTLGMLGQEYGVATTDDFSELCRNADVDAIAVATPAVRHADMVKEALEHNKHVFVEKPLALDFAVATQLVQLAEERELTLMVGHLLWYHPAVLKLKELIDDGELGRLDYIYSHRLNLGKFRTEENILWSFAPHDLSIILGILDEMPNDVRAQGGAYLQPSVADVTTTLLSFPSGAKAHIFVSWLHPFKEQRLVVIGSEKMAVFSDTANEKLVVYPHSVDWKNRTPIPLRGEPVNIAIDDYEPLRAECSHFLDCISGGITPRTDGREALRVLEVLISCQDAVTREGSMVEEATA